MTWEEASADCIKQVATQKRRFTGDDVMNLLEERGFSTGDSRALGPAMVRAAKAGLMEKTETFQASTRRSQHGSPRRVWQSCIFAGEIAQ